MYFLAQAVLLSLFSCAKALSLLKEILTPIKLSIKPANIARVLYVIPAWLGAARRHRRLLRHPGMSLQLKEATKQSKHHSNVPVQHREPLGGTSRAQAEKHSTGKKHPWENQTTASPLD